MKRILILEREYRLTETLLREIGFLVSTTTSAELALDMIKSDGYYALIIDPKNQNGQILDLLREANKRGLKAIITTTLPKEQLDYKENYVYFQKPLNTKKSFFEYLNES